MEKQRRFVFLAVCVGLALIMSIFPMKVRAEYLERPITMLVTFAPESSVFWIF